MLPSEPNSQIDLDHLMQATAHRVSMADEHLSVLSSKGVSGCGATSDSPASFFRTEANAAEGTVQMPSTTPSGTPVADAQAGDDGGFPRWSLETSGSPHKVSSEDAKKRKSKPEADAAEDDASVRKSPKRNGPVKRRRTIHPSESNTVAYPPASNQEAALASDATARLQADSVVPAAPASAPFRLNPDLLQAHELISHRAAHFHPGDPGIFDSLAFLHGQVLPVFGMAQPSMMAGDLLLGLGISGAGLAQLLPIPAFAQPNTNWMTTFELAALINHELHRRLNVARTAQYDLLSFGDDLLSRATGLARRTSTGLLGSTQEESNEASHVESSLAAREENSAEQKPDQEWCVPLDTDQDKNIISAYQYFIRKQIEVFEATAKEAGCTAQGRNRPILPGQVGIRCRHCARLEPKDRATGAVYFPNRMDGVYQTGEYAYAISWLEYVTIMINTTTIRRRR